MTTLRHSSKHIPLLSGQVNISLMNIKRHRKSSQMVKMQLSTTSRSQVPLTTRPVAAVTCITEWTSRKMMTSTSRTAAITVATSSTAAQCTFTSRPGRSFRTCAEWVTRFPANKRMEVITISNYNDQIILKTSCFSMTVKRARLQWALSVRTSWDWWTVELGTKEG